MRNPCRLPWDLSPVKRWRMVFCVNSESVSEICLSKYAVCGVPIDVQELLHFCEETVCAVISLFIVFSVSSFLKNPVKCVMWKQRRQNSNRLCQLWLQPCVCVCMCVCVWRPFKTSFYVVYRLLQCFVSYFSVPVNFAPHLLCSSMVLHGRYAAFMICTHRSRLTAQIACEWSNTRGSLIIPSKMYESSSVSVVPGQAWDVKNSC